MAIKNYTFTNWLIKSVSTQWWVHSLFPVIRSLLASFQLAVHKKKGSAKRFCHPQPSKEPRRVGNQTNLLLQILASDGADCCKESVIGDGLNYLDGLKIRLEQSERGFKNLAAHQFKGAAVKQRPKPPLKHSTSLSFTLDCPLFTNFFQ